MTPPFDALLAFRPPTVVAKLPRMSAACPVSLRVLVADAAVMGGPLPLVRAPTPAVARAGLVAARQLGCALCLELPAGEPPEAWFAAVVLAADQFAPRLPLVLAGAVALGTGSDEEVERARRETYRLVEAGLTHVSFDLDAMAEGGRAAALLRASEAAREREVGVECLLPLESGLPSLGGAAVLVEELAEWGVAPNAAGARFPLARGPSEERAQARLLGELCGWIEGTPVVRRGPVTPGLLEALRGLPVRACDDGGAALAAAARAAGLPSAAEGPPLGRGGRPLPPELGERPEAMAYGEVAGFLEGLGVAGSVTALVEALRARLEE